MHDQDIEAVCVVVQIAPCRKPEFCVYVMTTLLVTLTLAAESPYQWPFHKVHVALNFIASQHM